MDSPQSASRRVRVLIERPKHPALVNSAKALINNDPDPPRFIHEYPSWRDDFEIDDTFAAVAVGPGSRSVRRATAADLDPDASEFFVVRGHLRVSDYPDVPETLAGDAIFSDAGIGGLLTCGTSLAVGNADDVRAKLDTATLGANGLDGTNVAIAIVDSGIYLPHLAKQTKYPPNLDRASSWKYNTFVTPPGLHRLGHGTMCAYDALLAAPNAALIDIPLLLARAPGDHSAQGTAGAAMHAYAFLLAKWLALKNKHRYGALVVSNSWGIYHRNLDELPKGHPGRFIDNLNHPFHHYVSAITTEGADVVFAAGNCGGDCPSATCLGATTESIMGANAYSEVLTMAGCDIHDRRVGYSSTGPSIAGMPQHKPDITAYTHFLGSKARRNWRPDTGTSAACAVAAGCVAALRSAVSPAALDSPGLFGMLRSTARKVAGPGWHRDYGYGIIDPVAVARKLNLLS